jgi:cytochrome c peroxidase
MSRSASLILILFSVLLIQACRKDPPTQLEQLALGDLRPTSLRLDIPVWALDSVHPVILPGNNPLTVEGVALGRRLFYEKALSNDYSMSCGSCHQQAHAFSDPRQFSVGTGGDVGRRNSMTIQNAVWDHFFFWDTRAATLEEQAFGPVRNHAEMGNSWPVVEGRLRAHPEYPALFARAFGDPHIDSLRVVRAIAQFERTLLSFNSPYDRYVQDGDHTAMTEQQVRGMQLFFGDAHCGDCHAAPRIQDHGAQNIGLGRNSADLGMMEFTGMEMHRGRFKNPSLRNVAVSAPYMHDGRFSTLEQVVDFYADDVDLADPGLDQHMFAWTFGYIDLDAQERADLVAFMHALTDEEFLTDPAFSDPN